MTHLRMLQFFLLLNTYCLLDICYCLLGTQQDILELYLLSLLSVTRLAFSFYVT